ncbi:type III secretion protein [Pseudomonas caspiana]
MNALSSQQQAWQSLLDQPLSFIGAEHLKACFPANVSPQQLAALRQQERFQERLLRLLMSHFGLQALELSAQPDPLDLPVLLLPAQTFQELPRLCGAVWHASTLSREIRGDVVSELRRLLGNEVFALALAHRGAGGAADLLRQPAELLEVIDRDGAACVSAWLRAQPAELRQWLSLRFDDPQVHDLQIPGALDIVRRVAASRTRPAEEVA